LFDRYVCGEGSTECYESVLGWGDVLFYGTGAYVQNARQLFRDNVGIEAWVVSLACFGFAARVSHAGPDGYSTCGERIETEPTGCR